MRSLRRLVPLIAATLALACSSTDESAPGGYGGQPGSGGSSGASGTGGATDTDGAAGSGGVAGASGSGGDQQDAAPADAAPEGGIPSTHGSGGLSCTPATTWNDGQPYCLASIGDIELKLFVPSPVAGPMQVAIYLHGDTANGYYEDWGYEALSSWATSQGILFFAALAPNGCSWWRPKSSCSVDQYDSGYNAEQLAAALEKIGQAYDVYLEQLLFVGYSGGSTFLTRHFVPMYGDRYTGTMVLNCGGVDPQPFDWTPTAATAARVPLFYTFGSNDFMTEYIYPSMEEYEAMGFSVESLELQGYGHCDGDYDWDDRTIGLWASHRIP